MRTNKNGIQEGDFVKYLFVEMNDTFNGAQGYVIEIIDDPDNYAIMARVEWTDGTANVVAINNLFIVSDAKARAA